MGHTEGYGPRRLKLAATPVVSRKTSPSASQLDVSDDQKPHGQQRYDAESTYPPQINDAAMHETPEFERVSTRCLAVRSGI